MELIELPPGFLALAVG